MLPCSPSRAMRKSVASFVAMVSPEFSMSSHGETVMTWAGTGSPRRMRRSTVAMATHAPALSPTGVMSSGAIPCSISASITDDASSSWAG